MRYYNTNHSARSAIRVLLLAFVAVEASSAGQTTAFLPSRKTRTLIAPHGAADGPPQQHDPHRRRLYATKEHQQAIPVCGVVAPLLKIGPYPCLELRFPNLVNEPVWTFLLDTGANVNSIQASLVEQYKLERMPQDLHLLGSVGLGGTLAAPGDLVKLGDAQLHGLPNDQDNIIFMTNLTAASLPHASPIDGVAGVLGLSFFRSFAGVEFDWHSSEGEDGQEEPPTVQFLFTNDIAETRQKENNMTRVLLQQWGLAQVLLMNVAVNGVPLLALLDTGSPATILSEQAAQQAGVAAVTTPRDPHDVIRVGGLDKLPIELRRSESLVSICAGGENDEVEFGKGRVYVGTLPGLARIGSMVSSDGGFAPKMIAGRDLLSSTQCMLLKYNNEKDEWEAWFETRKLRN